MTIDETIVKELEAYFKMVALPAKVVLAPGSTIMDVPKFIEAQFRCVGSEGHSPVRKLAVDRLQQLRSILEGQA